MTFYRKCLGGELTFQTVTETPIADQCPAGTQDQVIHSMPVVKDSVVLMATDMTQSEGIKRVMIGLFH